MAERPGPTTTQEFKPVKAGGPDDTLEPGSPKSSDTQPYIPFRKRHPLEPGDEAHVDALIEQLKLDDPQFVQEVRDAFQGTFSTYDIEILSWRHITGEKYAFIANVDGQPRELVVERQTKPKLPERP